MAQVPSFFTAFISSCSYNPYNSTSYHKTIATVFQDRLQGTRVYSNNSRCADTLRMGRYNGFVWENLRVKVGEWISGFASLMGSARPDLVGC